MKKLLSLLGKITLITSTMTATTACGREKKIQQEETDNNIKENEITLNAKILNEIVNNINKKMLEYLNSNSYINSKNYAKGVMDIFYDKVNAQNQILKLNSDDVDIKEGISIIKNNFKTFFDKINREIKREYSNIYIDNFPLTLNEDITKNNLKFINLEQIKKLDSTVDTSDLKIVTYELKIQYIINYKKTTTHNNFVISHIITNDINKIKQFQSGIISKLSKIIVGYFNDNIILDKNEHFKDLYNNFDINYSREHFNLDNIIQSQINTKIKKHDELSKINNLIKWDANQPIIFLQSIALNDITSGVTTPVKKENTAYIWAGNGKFDATKIKPKDFYNFLINLLSIFNIKDTFQVASFNVNLSKISVAGIPLSGVINVDKKPLNFNIRITKEGLKNKLMNYATIVTKFFEIYKIECYEDKQILNVSEELFNNIKSANNYTDSLKKIIADFKLKKDVINLPDINLFNIDNYYANVSNKPVWYMEEKTTQSPLVIRVKQGNNIINKSMANISGYSFSFMFGDGTFNNSISWSPWSFLYFPNLYIKKI